MIGQLRGRLVAKQPNQVVVDVGGVGYLVQIPLSTFTGLGEVNSETTLLIHTHVREDWLFPSIASESPNSPCVDPARPDRPLCIRVSLPDGSSQFPN